MFFRRSDGLWTARRPATSRRSCWDGDRQPQSSTATTDLLKTLLVSLSRDWLDWLFWCLVNLTARNKASGHVTSDDARATLCYVTAPTGTTLPPYPYDE